MYYLKNKLFALFVLLLSIINIYGCRCSCNCELCLSCTQLTATWSANDSIIENQKYCSTIDNRIDTAYFASINRFYTKYDSSSYKITRKDTNISCNGIKIGCHSEGPKGYFCDVCNK